MKTKKQLQREITAAQRENIRLRNDNEFLKAEKQTYKLALAQAKADLKDARNMATNNDEIVRRQEGAIRRMNKEHIDLRDRLAAAREAEADARALADKLLYINDVLCAEMQDCDRCIDTVRMALEQKSAHAELLKRITGPLV